ncbi:hypothetical protein LL912_23040 [Niabella sp. CC-SYL272]|uniref:hypothetical protein n=1 Tax=Niabella agricola TaxID=2891571 RepID=UPI001F2484F9|nr:hypothetical protein [Niabella agricola]MCF3111682.1 hypothetical protein [Niabella agricola]
MTTMAQRQVNDLQTVLYRLLVKGTTRQQRVTDHSEGKGLFETASVVDPFGAIFRMMSVKEEQAELFEKDKPL